jgi:hypothetical protein
MAAGDEETVDDDGEDEAGARSAISGGLITTVVATLGVEVMSSANARGIRFCKNRNEESVVVTEESSGGGVRSGVVEVGIEIELEVGVGMGGGIGAGVGGSTGVGVDVDVVTIGVEISDGAGIADVEVLTGDTSPTCQTSVRPTFVITPEVAVSGGKNPPQKICAPDAYTAELSVENGTLSPAILLPAASLMPSVSG